MKRRFTGNHKRKQTRTRKNYMRRKINKFIKPLKKKYGKRTARYYNKHLKKKIQKGG